jgi:hypothetical protein
MSEFASAVLLALVNYCAASTARLIDIEIVTPAYFGLDSLASTSYLYPAFTTGLAGLRQRYPQFNVSHRFLTDANASTCVGQQASVQDILSRWYYQEGRDTSIPVILTGGKFPKLMDCSTWTQNSSHLLCMNYTVAECNIQKRDHNVVSN